jgi:hypothetical protein
MSNPTPIRRIDIVPGRLSANVYHIIVPARAGQLPCWVYLSEGLRAHGQREIAFTLRRHESEDPARFPEDPLHFFSAVLRLAEQGKLVDSGGYSELGERGMFGDAGVRGIGYLRMHPCLGIPAPADALAAIPLVGAELEFAKACGITRVMATLGNAARQYPFPPWHERGRQALISPAALGQTIVSKVASFFLGGATISKGAQGITLRLPLARIAEIRGNLAQLPPTAGLAILTDLDVHADAYFYWGPGQKSPLGISPEGSSGAQIAGCFALFIPEQAEYGAQIFEDGFALSFPQPMWEGLRQAISYGNRFSHPPTGGAFGLSIEWDVSAGAPPIAGTGAAVAGELYVRLPHSLIELSTRLPQGGFNEYMDALEKALHAAAKALPPGPGQDLRLTVTLRPGGPVEIHIMSKPGMEQNALAHLHGALMGVRAPQVTGGPLGFNGAVALWGGTGAPLDPG